MNDAATVRGRECVGHLQADQESSFQFEWTTRDELPHVLAFDELHGDEMNAVNFIEIEDRADVWVIQRRGEPCFAFETFEVSFLCAEFRRYDFDHNRASKLVVGGFVNRALPANTELVCDLIVAKRLADHIFSRR